MPSPPAPAEDDDPLRAVAAAAVVSALAAAPAAAVAGVAMVVLAEWPEGCSAVGLDATEYACCRLLLNQLRTRSAGSPTLSARDSITPRDGYLVGWLHRGEEGGGSGFVQASSPSPFAAANSRVGRELVHENLNSCRRKGGSFAACKDLQRVLAHAGHHGEPASP